jgi:Predicted signal-transduction protein containing cAMP-binding and CBS domains
MKVGEYCKRAVVAINGKADAAAAAQLMRNEHVGFLIVYRDGDELQRPVGVLTDRDLVLAVMARDVDAHTVTVEDVMTRQPLIANESDELSDLLQAMRMAGIRRVPVVDVRGALVGIIAIDDAIDVITGLMCDISGSIKHEQRQEWRARTG